MNNRNRVWQLLLAICLSSHCGLAQAQPEQMQQAESSSGVAYPEKPMTPAQIKKANQKWQNDMWKQMIGTADAKELEATQHVLPGKNVRSLLAEHIRKISIKGNGEQAEQQKQILVRGQLNYIDSPPLHSVLPDRLFYRLSYRQWPVAMNIPAPLTSNNIFIIDRAGAIRLINEVEVLNGYIKRELSGVGSEDKAKTAAQAYLALYTVLMDDGMFRFQTPVAQSERTPQGLIATGSSSVDPNGGNRGKVSVRMTFDGQGKVASIQPSSDLQEGIRPICQSTKLLDRDPIVREMARRDILVMGRACKPYLDAQRPKVSPALRREIDRIWQQIVREGR